MAKQGYKKGDRVNIFFDALTETRFDATAIVKKVLNPDNGVYEGARLQLLLIEYESIPGSSYERNVLYHA